jgi:hypothetical protein
MQQCAACQFDDEFVDLERLSIPWSILANRFLRPPISEGGTVLTVLNKRYTSKTLHFSDLEL